MTQSWTSARPLRVLAVDPGREKCGVAVVDAREGVLARGVVPSAVVGDLVRTWAAAHHPRILVVGRGTAYRYVVASLDGVDLPLEVFPEAHTTLRARRRYFEDQPPKGWRKLVPLGLLSPPVPIDDYAAVLIAEDYLAANGK